MCLPFHHARTAHRGPISGPEPPYRPKTLKTMCFPNEIPEFSADMPATPSRPQPTSGAKHHGRVAERLQAIQSTCRIANPMAKEHRRPVFRAAAAPDFAPPAPGQDRTADAVFPCRTCLRTLEAIPRVQARIDKPALSSNTAFAWHVARLNSGHRSKKLRRFRRPNDIFCCKLQGAACLIWIRINGIRANRIRN
ncbi:hypothetical protein SAMN05444279_12631 [Ruegeria intermedia]|uniref:Uncharacterized protein n=1 Tax=Ruegeria intermedia TaxID=996115 RepID=A0A1M5AJ68_9RHOB|nr:hypothetical protein SAMN05444279_12631 [Ruegeria intermedia]